MERDREEKKEGIKKTRGSWRKIERGREEWEKKQETKLGKDRAEKRGKIQKRKREYRKEREKDRDAVRKKRKKGKLYSWRKTDRRREELEKK